MKRQQEQNTSQQNTDKGLSAQDAIHPSLTTDPMLKGRIEVFCPWSFAGG